MAAPHTAAVAALMLEKNPALTQAEVESILKSTALPFPPGSGGDIQITGGFADMQVWGANATGSGLIQAGAAVAATP
jgi:subtilisin family serine protease